jgi:hypothetical protein
VFAVEMKVHDGSVNEFQATLDRRVRESLHRG